MFRRGDWVLITWRGNTARTIPELPREAAGRMAWVETQDGKWVTLGFPYPVKFSETDWRDQLVLDVTHRQFHIDRENVITRQFFDEFPQGPTRETCMVPVDMLYVNYWDRFGENDPAWTYNDSSYPLQRAIEREGLRAPVVLGHDFGIRHGSHRVLVYKRMGRELIECYITDKAGGKIKFRVPPSRPVGCTSRFADEKRV